MKVNIQKEKNPKKKEYYDNLTHDVEYESNLKIYEHIESFK